MNQVADDRQSPAVPAPLRALVLWLRVSLAAMAIGVALDTWRENTPLFGVFWHVFGWPEATAVLALRVSAVALVAAAVLLWWRRLWWLLVLLGLYMLAVVAARMHDVELFWRLVPGAHAARWATPLALALLIAMPLRDGLRGWQVGVAVFVLRLAAGATFVCHGIEALELHGPFQDLIYAAGRRLLGVDVRPETAELLLRAIGVVDVAVGVAIVVVRSRTLALWMAFWGFLTAASRIVHSGVDSTAEALLRAPNGGVPLALFLYWHLSRARALDVEREPEP